MTVPTRSIKPLLLSLAALAGALLPVQFAVNGALARFSGSLAGTATVSYTVGALTLGLGLLLSGRAVARLRALRGAPTWSLLGGAVGSAYVLGSVVLTRALGTGLAVALVIAAQVLFSLALDHFGWLGLPRRRFGRVRLAVAALVVTALALQVLP